MNKQLPDNTFQQAGAKRKLYKDQYPAVEVICTLFPGNAPAHFTGTLYTTNAMSRATLTPYMHPRIAEIPVQRKPCQLETFEGLIPS